MNPLQDFDWSAWFADFFDALVRFIVEYLYRFLA